MHYFFEGVELWHPLSHSSGGLWYLSSSVLRSYPSHSGSGVDPPLGLGALVQVGVRAGKGGEAVGVGVGPDFCQRSGVGQTQGRGGNLLRGNKS